MTAPNKDVLSIEAQNVSDMLWAVEGLFEDMPFEVGNSHQKRCFSASLAIVRSAQQMLAKLADDIDRLPNGGQA